MAALAAPAIAGNLPLVTSGSNSNSNGGVSSNWSNIYIPATCNISSFVQINVTRGGGGGVSVTRSGVTVLNFYTTGGSGVYSNSGSATAQPAGYYNVSQGFGGPPYTMSGYISTTFSW